MNNVASASLAVGIDPDTMTTDQLNGPITDWLMKMKGQIRALAPSIGDQISLLASGDVDYMVCGLTFMDAETAKKGVTTKTIVPSEGAIGWADTTFITPTPRTPRTPTRSRTTCSTRRRMPRRTARSCRVRGRGVDPDAVGRSEGAVPVQRHRQLPEQHADLQHGVASRTRRRPGHLRPGDRGLGGGQGFLRSREGVPLSRRFAALLLTPLGALLLLAVTVPVAMLFAFSFFHIDALLRLAPGFTTDNYHRVLTTKLYRTYALNTVLIAGPTAVLSIVGGYILAYYLAFRAGRARGLLLVAIVIALMGSYLALIYSWRTLSGEHGIINSLLQAVHLTDTAQRDPVLSHGVVIAEVNSSCPSLPSSCSRASRRSTRASRRPRVTSARRGR